MKQLLEHLEEIGPTGSTCREVQNYFELDHGAASGALTRLHRAGLVARLKETRDGQQVYVALMHAGDRETSEYRPNSAYREDRKPMPLERTESEAKRQFDQGNYSHLARDMKDEGIELDHLIRIAKLIRKYR